MLKYYHGTCFLTILTYLKKMYLIFDVFYFSDIWVRLFEIVDSTTGGC